MNEQTLDQVLCPYCQGGNPPDAPKCMWCGKALGGGTLREPSRGERWVRHWGRQAVSRSYAPALYIVAGLIFYILIIFWGGGSLSTIISAGAVLIFLWLTALLWYERRKFYEIIMEQEKRLAELGRGISGR